MNAISKKVVVGIVFSFALLPYLSCSLEPLLESEDTGSVELSVSIPASLDAASPLPAALKEAFAPEAASRFIHPYTRLVSVSISTNNPEKPITSSVSVARDAGAISIRVAKVPIGQRTVTISLYDENDVLLARGEETVRVGSKRATAAAVSAVPVLYESMNPGPYAEGSRGIQIPDSGSRSFRVYRVEVPAAGPYALRYLLRNESHVLGTKLYDAEGRPVETQQVTNGTDTFDAVTLSAGTFYIAAQVPTLAAEDIVNLSLDADLRVSVSAIVINVDSGLQVMDRKRDFYINIQCGLHASLPFGVTSFGGNVTYNGNATFTRPDTRTMAVNLARDSIESINADPTEGVIFFTDALLGIERTNVPFILPAQPRTFVYCNSGGVAPSGTEAWFCNNLAEAFNGKEGTNWQGGDAGSPIVAISGSVPSRVTPEEAHIENKEPIVLGGFTLEGSRTAGSTPSTVTFPTLPNALTVNAAGTRFDSVRFGFPDATVNINLGNTYIFDLGASTTFVNCSFQGPPFNVVTAAAANTLCAFMVVRNATTSFDRCSIIGGTVAFTGGGAGNVCALYRGDAAVAPLSITNSLICPGRATAADSTAQAMTGIHAAQSGSTLNIVGSTISGGMGSITPHPQMKAIFMSTSASTHLYLHNSALVAQDLSNANSALLHLNAAPNADSVFNRVAYGYASRTAYIINYNGDIVTPANWDPQKAYCAESYLAPFGTLDFLSTDPASADFLRPSAASDPFLVSGGWDLSPSGHPLSGGLAAFTNARLSLDRDGRARTGNGTTGFSVGAFEVN